MFCLKRLIILASCLLLSLFPLAIGQQTKQPPSKKEVATIDIPPTTYREVGQAQVSYFLESNTTEVRVELSPYHKRNQSANMFFVFTVKGKEIKQPSLVSVGMAFFSDKQTLQTISGFSFELGQESVRPDDFKVGGIGYDNNAKNSFRDMEASIPFTVFQKLAASTPIKVRVNDLVFEFSSHNHSALGDMLKTIR